MPRLLLIDDDDTLRLVLSRVLESMGHVVQGAANGRQGLAMAESGAFALVLTDILMPEKDGFETILGLRRILPPPRVVAMSGGGPMTPEECLRIAKKLGASRVLEKPFTHAELEAAVNAELASASITDAR